MVTHSFSGGDRTFNTCSDFQSLLPQHPVRQRGPRKGRMKEKGFSEQDPHLHLPSSINSLIPSLYPSPLSPLPLPRPLPLPTSPFPPSPKLLRIRETFPFPSTLSPLPLTPNIHSSQPIFNHLLTHLPQRQFIHSSQPIFTPYLPTQSKFNHLPTNPKQTQSHNHTLSPPHRITITPHSHHTHTTHKKPT